MKLNKLFSQSHSFTVSRILGEGGGGLLGVWTGRIPDRLGRIARSMYVIDTLIRHICGSIKRTNYLKHRTLVELTCKSPLIDAQKADFDANWPAESSIF